jgi:hypothetical protein
MGTIAGHVSLGTVSTSAGAGQVRVSYSLCFEGDVCQPSLAQPVGSVLTDASGNYSVPSLENATYTLSFALASGANYQPADPLVVVVSNAQTAWTGRDATLSVASSMSGTVYLGSTSTPAGAGDVTIFYSKLINSDWSELGSVTTTATGNYLIPNLANGWYRVRFDYNGDAYADEWWNDVYSTRDAASISLSAPQTGMNATLAAGGTISGVVTDWSGNPVAGVQAFAKAYYDTNMSGDAYSKEYSLTVGNDGHYTFAGLPFGTNYTIRFFPPGATSLIQQTISTGPLGAGQPLTVPTTTRLYSPAFVDGYVTCEGCDVPSGFGPRNDMSAQLETRATAGDPWVAAPGGDLIQGYSGYFQLRGFSPGEYRLVIYYTGNAGYAAKTRSAPFTLVEGQFLHLGNVPVPNHPDAVYGGLVSLAPARLLDTRIGNGAPVGAVGPGGVVSLQVTGRGGVPASGVSAVVLNVTVAGSTGGGWITAYADGAAHPTASNLNFVAGQIVPNLVVVPVGANGRVDLYNSAGSTQLVADVEGYYLSGTPTEPGAFVSLAPARLLDTRIGNGAPVGAVGPGGVVSLQVTGRGGVPASGVSAVVLNVTVAGSTGGGWITAYADGAAHPTASNLNFVAGQIVPNLVVVPVGANGRVDLYNSAGSTQLVADVEGYYLSG